MLKLTVEQEEAVDSIKKFLDDPDLDNNIFTLQGVGGSGKTSTIIYALDPYKQRKVIVGGTISHSAKVVLDKALERAKIRCYTVAQLLELTQIIDEETGEISFKPVKKSMNKSPLLDADIVLIDECSMLDEELHSAIIKKSKKGAKIIYLGDPSQLPPIGDENSDSPTFNHTRATLTKAMRYKGLNTILGDRLREEIRKYNEGEQCSQYVINEWQTSELGNSCRTSEVDEHGNGYIFLNDLDVMMNIAVKGFSENSHNTDDMRIIAFRNTTIKIINEKIRHLLYGDDLQQFMEGELVICDGGYSAKKEFNSKPRPCIYNNEIFRISSTVKTNGPYDIPALMPVLDPPVALQQGERIYIVDEKGREKYDSILKSLQTKARENGSLWRNYYLFRDNFAEFNYTYTQSSHKSQGRTYRDVIVLEKDILDVSKIDVKVKLQSLYVACTRASRRVYIFNTKYKVDNSGLPEDLRNELGI